jgi:hypothetical protein
VHVRTQEGIEAKRAGVELNAFTLEDYKVRSWGRV